MQLLNAQFAFFALSFRISRRKTIKFYSIDADIIHLFAILCDRFEWTNCNCEYARFSTHLLISSFSSEVANEKKSSDLSKWLECGEANFFCVSFSSLEFQNGKTWCLLIQLRKLVASVGSSLSPSRQFRSALILFMHGIKMKNHSFILFCVEIFLSILLFPPIPFRSCRKSCTNCRHRISQQSQNYFFFVASKNSSFLFSKISYTLLVARNQHKFSAANLFGTKKGRLKSEQVMISRNKKKIIFISAFEFFQWVVMKERRRRKRTQTSCLECLIRIHTS